MKVNQDRLIQIFFELVSINAVSKQEKPVADYIRTFLKKYNIPVIEDQAGQIVGGTSGNLIAKIHPNAKAAPSQFCLAAHMDTVKPTTGIKPQIKNEKIYSDGQTILGADNRAGIALILYLVESLKQLKAHVSFEVVFTIGEETGLYGSTHLDINQLESRIVYILDSSADPGSYVYAAPTAIDFTIDFVGKASHAAVNPQAGINAISMAAHLIQNFAIGKVNNETTINFGKINGGEANNVIPAKVILTGEIRSFLSEHIENYFQRLIKQLRDTEKIFAGQCHIQREESFPGFILDQESKAVRRLISCFQAIGLESKPLRYHGGSDANILNNRGLIAIDLGIGAKNPHANDEYIKIEDLLTILRFLHQLVSSGDE
jgi:tripeptide aminopeptidase